MKLGTTSWTTESVLLCDCGVSANHLQFNGLDPHDPRAFLFYCTSCERDHRIFPFPETAPTDTKTFLHYLDKHAVSTSSKSYNSALEGISDALYDMLVEKRRVRGSGNVRKLDKGGVVGHLEDKLERLRAALEREKEAIILKKHGHDYAHTELSSGVEVVEALGDIMGWSMMGLLIDLNLNELPLE